MGKKVHPTVIQVQLFLESTIPKPTHANFGITPFSNHSFIFRALGDDEDDAGHGDSRADVARVPVGSGGSLPSLISGRMSMAPSVISGLRLMRMRVMASASAP